MKVRIEWEFDALRGREDDADQGVVEVRGDDGHDLWLAAFRAALAGAGYSVDSVGRLQFVDPPHDSSADDPMPALMSEG